jgi:hypothetical protein
MDATPEEKSAFDEGFSEMLGALRAGDIPPGDSIGKELQTLFDLAPKSERVAVHQRGADLEIGQTVSAERSQAQIPTCRFRGKMAALLGYAKACRAHGFKPSDA